MTLVSGDMLTRVVQTVMTGIFFRTYFDLVNQYNLFQEYGFRSCVINPLSVVHEYNLKGFQAIHHAVQVGHLSATMALIEQFGADINAVTTLDVQLEDSKLIPKLSTPLIISIITGNFEIFCYLLSKPELDLNTANDQLASPLHFAAQHGELVMIEALLDKGARISFLKGTRISPFHVALEHGQLNVIEWLVNNKLGIGPVASGKRGNLESSLHFLARLKLSTAIWIRSLLICLKIPASGINFKSLDNLTPLQCAIETGNESAIVGFVLLGANTSGSLHHPLITAVRGFFDSEGKIDPFFVNSDSETIWHLIARINSVPLAEGISYFHPSNPNLHLKNRIGETALDLAIEMQNFDVAFQFFKLYEHQIDPELLEKIASFAIWNYFPVVLEKLIKEFANNFTEMVDSSSQSTLFLHFLATSLMRGNFKESKVMALLLIKSFPQMIRSLDQSGRTPLHVALESEFWDFFHWLKEANEAADSNLNFNVQDGSGVFLSDSLKEQGQDDIAKLLNLN